MKKVVIVSDIHCGSQLAVCPQGAIRTQMSPAKAIRLTLNNIQHALLQAWNRCVKDWERPDILVINGEPVEGPQRKNLGNEVWSPNMKDQLDAAKKLIDSYHAKQIYLTRGSDYHVTIEGTPLEEYFGEMIGAVQVDGYYAPNEVTLDIEDVPFNFAHHVGGTSTWQYRSTSLSREMAMMALNRNHRWPATVICRSHVHFYWGVLSVNHLGISTPCWKIQDWLAYRRSAAGNPSDIGAIRFTVDGEKYSWEPKIFRLPEFKPPHVKVK